MVCHRACHRSPPASDDDRPKGGRRRPPPASGAPRPRAAAWLAVARSHTLVRYIRTCTGTTGTKVPRYKVPRYKVPRSKVPRSQFWVAEKTAAADFVIHEILLARRSTWLRRITRRGAPFAIRHLPISCDGGCLRCVLPENSLPPPAVCVPTRTRKWGSSSVKRLRRKEGRV